MKIYDKAEWQVDNGMAKEVVIEHFSLMFNWLKAHNMLNKNGLDILDIGIDEEVSLNEGLITDEGVKFLDMYYDEIIAQSEYNVELEKNLLSALHEKFKQV